MERRNFLIILGLTAAAQALPKLPAPESEYERIAGFCTGSGEYWEPVDWYALRLTNVFRRTSEPETMWQVHGLVHDNPDALIVNPWPPKDARSYER